MIIYLRPGLINTHCLSFYKNILILICCLLCQAEIPDMIDLPDADSVARKDRTELRLTDELQHFDDDYYM